MGRAVAQYGWVSPGDKKWSKPDIQQYPYDPARALALLKEIGIEKRRGEDTLTDADGNKIEFVINTNVERDARKRTAVLIASDLKKIGFHVIFQPLDFNTIVSRMTETYEYDCILLGAYSNFPDPAESMNSLKSSGFYTAWFPRQKLPSTDWEARLDYLMDAQMRTLNDTERKKYYDEVQEILADQQPMIFTATPIYYAAIRSDVGNVRATPLKLNRSTWNGEELFFKAASPAHR